eukprot:3691643-Rhodomonas_salina.3
MAEVPPALLESVVVVIPTLFRLPDEDILHSDVSVPHSRPEPCPVLTSPMSCPVLTSLACSPPC